MLLLDIMPIGWIRTTLKQNSYNVSSMVFHFADPLLRLFANTDKAFAGRTVNSRVLKQEMILCKVLRRFRPQIGMCCSLHIKLQLCVHEAANTNYFRLRVRMPPPEELYMWAGSLDSHFCLGVSPAHSLSSPAWNER